MSVVLNILRHIESDDQQTWTSKANFNWDQILAMGGGPPGLTGNQGIQGVPGSQGVIGFTGDPGTPGSKWYVEDTDPTTFGLFSPSPNDGDFWFDTASLDIYKYYGSPATWVLTGNLTIAGIFMESATDSDRIVFSSPTPLKSLVISPIDYGIGAPQPGPYKLKLVGSPGSPIQNFSVLESGAENLAAKQSYISINTVTAGSEYSWELVNPTGNIELSAYGTSFDLVKESSNISKYEFNSTSFKIQINPAERLMSFYTTPASLNWHVGGHNALTSTSQRLLSVNDGGSIGIGDAFNNAVTGDSTAYDFRYDQYNVQLGLNPGDQNKWARWRAKVDSSTMDQLSIRNVRGFYDTSLTPWKSSEIRIEHKTNSTYNHFISFSGGATELAAGDDRPAFRLGVGGTENDGYYFIADSGNGGATTVPRIWIGTSAYVKEKTGTLTGGVDGGKLNIQGISDGANMDTSGHTAIHLNFGAGAAANAQVGITGGNIDTPEETNAGFLFQSLSGAHEPMAATLAAGDSLGSGMRSIFSAWSSGESFFWSRSNGDAYLRVRAGGYYSGTVSAPTPLVLRSNDVFDITAYDDLNGAKSILLNTLTTYTGFGDGFVGIGEQFGETISAGSSALTIGKWYKSNGSAIHNSIDYEAGVPFQAVSAVLTSGTVVDAKPQTKFQAYGAATFGTRANITTSYAANVGTLSFTVGTGHSASGSRSAIIGGQSHVVSGANSVLIGYDGSTAVNISTANVAAIVTRTFIGSGAPFWNSSTTDFGNNNNLSIDVQDATAENGLDIRYSYFGGTPSLDESAAIQIASLDTSGFPLSPATRFVVRGDGVLGINISPLTYTDPVLTSGQSWFEGISATDVWPGITARSSSTSSAIGGSIVLAGTTPSTSVTTIVTGGSIFTTSSFSGSSSSTTLPLRGRSMLIHPGITRNVNTGALTEAKGGDIYIRGGRGEKNASSVLTGTTYGNVRLVHDPQNSANAAGHVTVGVGTPFSAIYLGRITVTKSSDSAGSVALVYGTDHNGASYSVAGTYSSSAGVASVVVTLPTAFSTANIVCVANVDSDDSNDYQYTATCSGRSTTTLNFTIVHRGITGDVNSWATGTTFPQSMDFSFSAYCMP